MKLDVLVFGAHPDDIELGCGGTIIKLLKAKRSVGIIDLTKGELGTRGSSKKRTQETKNSNKVLGITIRENMRFSDGFFEIATNKENKFIFTLFKIGAFYQSFVCSAIVI